ncbi:MAG: sulfur carrier protein ThiS [Bacteroidota bacterium]|nr:sulfur carrier protein ThiS [Bacteroidota bacterium]
MTVVINGKKEDLDQPTGLTELLRQKQIDPDAPGFAVAINEAVVFRKVWPEVMLREGDSVEIIRATQWG